MTTWRTPRCEVADRLRDRLYVMCAIYYPHHRTNPHYLEAAELLDRHMHRSGCERCAARREEMREWERQKETV